LNCHVNVSSLKGQRRVQVEGEEKGKKVKEEKGKKVKEERGKKLKSLPHCSSNRYSLHNKKKN
jgi:hypothetical protein